MKKFDTLYTRNSNGSINEWNISISDEKSLGVIIIKEGQLEGKKTVSKRQCKGKNINKMNETSPYEQACSEAESRWKLKKKKGYKSLDDLKITFKEKVDSIYKKNYDYHYGVYDYDSLETALEDVLPKTKTDENNLSKPMLALPLFDPKTGKSRASFPIIAQPKLNGFRMMCRWEKVMEGEGIFRQEVEKPVFRSRDGIRFDTLEHIERELPKKLFFNSHTLEYNIILDGELYNHGWLLQRINSAVNKKNNDTKDLKFFIFDIAVENLSQEDRLIKLRNNIQYSKDAGFCNNITVIKSILLYSIEEAENITNQFIKEGYEGSILRNPKATYQFGKRGKSMLKLKRFQDKEFKILDVVSGDNSPDLGVFICIAENGKTFKCIPQGTHEIKREYLSNKQNYIGKMLTVKFYERTADRLPFHTTGLTIREFM